MKKMQCKYITVYWKILIVSGFLQYVIKMVLELLNSTIPSHPKYVIDDHSLFKILIEP